MPTTPEHKIAKSLAKHDKLTNLLSEPPQVFVVPADYPRQGNGLIIWLYLRRESISLENIAGVILHAIQTPHDRGYFQDFVGVNPVVAVRCANGGTDRILSVLVHDDVRATAIERLCCTDLLEWPAIEGVECSWFWDPMDLRSGRSGIMRAPKRNKRDIPD